MGVVDLGLDTVFGRLSGKLGEFIKRILYLCFASFVRTTYNRITELLDHAVCMGCETEDVGSDTIGCGYGKCDAKKMY